jgi:hypothetical protein
MLSLAAVTLLYSNIQRPLRSTILRTLFQPKLHLLIARRYTVPVCELTKASGGALMRLSNRVDGVLNRHETNCDDTPRLRVPKCEAASTASRMYQERVFAEVRGAPPP